MIRLCLLGGRRAEYSTKPPLVIRGGRWRVTGRIERLSLTSFPAVTSHAGLPAPHMQPALSLQPVEAQRDHRSSVAQSGMEFACLFWDTSVTS
jgi:hypothetical protein